MGNVLKVMKAGKATKNTLAAFESLNALLKASDSGAAAQIKPHAHELVDIYVALISRHAETKKMAEIALRSLGYFTYNSVAVSQLNEAQSERILTVILDVITTSEVKSACNLAVWCIAIQQLRHVVAKRVKDIIVAVTGLIDTVNARFASSSTIEYEAIAAFGKLLAQIPDLMVKQAEAWLPAVYTRLFHENPAVREKAEAVVNIALPLLVKSGIAPAISSKLVGDLTGGMLERFNLFLDEESTIQGKDKPCLAIRVWGYLVILLQKELWSSGLIKAFLQIPSTTFNHADPNVRIVTWNGWKSLMDNCMHDMQHLLRPKSKRTDLLMKPFLSSVEREQSVEVKKALVQSWMHLVSGFGSSLPTVFSRVFFPFLELVAKVPETELAEEVFQFVGKLVALPDASDSSAEPRPLPLEADWVVDDFALFVLQILPSCISRTSDAILDVWQGLVARVAHLHAQDPESKRVIAVVSQVVHFLSDLLASGTALSGDKDAPPLPLGYASTVLTRFLRAFSAVAANKSPHTSFKLALSPHYALSDSSSPSAHASTSTILGVLLRGLFSNPNAIKDQKQFGDTLQLLLSVTPAKKADQVNPNTSLLTALYVLQSLLESSVSRKTNQKVLMLGWLSVARSLEERMDETNCAADTPFPFALPNKHDHRTVYYTALLFPLRAALQGDGQSSWTVLVDGTVGDIKKTWNSFYSTFFRINALKDEAEGCVDHLCHLIMEILRPGIRWNNGVGKIIEATYTMVEVAGPTHAFIASCSRPRGATKNRSKPSDPSTLVGLLLRLFNAMSVYPETLARQEEYEHEWMKDKDQATKQLIMNEWQLSLSYLADTITALYSKARGRAEVLCLVSTFGEGIAKWLKDSPVPPDSSVVLSRSAATNMRKELDKLFDVVAKAVTTNHKPPYDDAESLKLLAPLLTEALVTKRKVLKNAAIQFWNATFGTAPSLTVVPEGLIAVLAKLQDKVPIKLPPGWNGDTDVTPSMSSADMASLVFADDDTTHVPTQVFPGFDAPHKFHKPTAPAAVAAPQPESPRRLAKRKRSVAPAPVESQQDEKENDRKYVDTVNRGGALKKPKNDKDELLTDHQREVLERQRKEVKAVAFYNGLDQSSQDGANFNLFAAGSLFTSPADDDDGAPVSVGASSSNNNKSSTTTTTSTSKVKAEQAARKAKAEAEAEDAAKLQREKELREKRERLEKERREVEELEQRERERSNSKETVRLRRRASLNWRKEQIERQEKEEDDAPAAKRQKQQNDNNDDVKTKKENKKEKEEKEEEEEAMMVIECHDDDGRRRRQPELRQMLEALCGSGETDGFEAQMKDGAAELLAGFDVRQLFAVQDKLTRLLSATTQQLRTKLSN